MKNNTKESWMYKYNLAKVYFEHHGNLEIPYHYKTLNGYEYTEEGIALGIWITNQRQAYKGQGSNKITENQIQLLEEIGMRFETRDNNEEWNRKYKLAKAYFEHHGNLKTPRDYKTFNGYEYTEEGIALGMWIKNQRQAYKGQGSNKITENQIQLLEKIGMRFETNYKEEEWNKKYGLAKAYFEHNVNLEIPCSYKTLNGYEYAEEGIALGAWLITQRQAYKGMSNCKITENQIQLLEEIGMRFETNYKEEEWNKKYGLAKAYFEHHGNLKIPIDYKTLNGYEYTEEGIALGRWITNQRQTYKGQNTCKITETQIKLLEEIRIKWFLKVGTDKKSQEEVITEKNSKRKQIEMLNRVRSYLNTLDESEVLSKEEINQGMMDRLNHKIKRLKIKK